MEEKFFFMYHLKMPYSEVIAMPINERKWMIQRFLQQKDMEADAYEKARKKK